MCVLEQKALFTSVHRGSAGTEGPQQQLCWHTIERWLKETLNSAYGDGRNTQQQHRSLSSREPKKSSKSISGFSLYFNSFKTELRGNYISGDNKLQTSPSYKHFLWCNYGRCEFTLDGSPSAFSCFRLGVAILPDFDSDGSGGLERRVSLWSSFQRSCTLSWKG